MSGAGMRVAVLLLLAVGLVPVSGIAEVPTTPPVIAQQPGLHPTPPPAQGPHTAPPSGDLDCRACHQGTHQGVVQMYVGLGGRGTPMIPSHMFQVRVQCIACHIVPEQPKDRAAIVGQTFKPSEQACRDCHGEKYRGMLSRWTTTLAKMRDIVAPKLATARAALAAADVKSSKATQARKLLDDAAFNVQFVEFGKGAHNVFYAADLLKLGNSWIDESLVVLGKPRVKSDDALVRGGYCAVLCHEQAGVKQPPVVTFGTQKIPHVRHVTEFGAVCTACHSAEVHKAVTAKPATCTGCHHGPENERCESCHRAQSGFYRGDVKTVLGKVEPNVMASAVSCTGCHDWSGKHSRQAVAQKCLGCHDASYTGFLTEWTSGLDKETARAADAVKRAEAAVARARRAGHRNAEAEDHLKQARATLALVKTARPVHNPTAADTLLEATRKNAEAALGNVNP
jgi:hypothetical protein